MKKCLIILLVVLFLCPMVNAKEVYVSSNTVSFSTTAFIVTFNTVVNSIRVYNKSATEIVQVQFDGSRIGWNSTNTAYILPTKSNSFRVEPATNVSVDVSTEKIGIIGRAGSGTIDYIVTSDRRVAND